MTTLHMMRPRGRRGLPALAAACAVNAVIAAPTAIPSDTRRSGFVRRPRPRGGTTLVSWTMSCHVHASRALSFSVDIDLTCRDGYCLERLHPDARASPSVQNHRSPFEVLIRVWS